MAKKNTGGDALAVQNAAKTLLANICFASVDNPIKSIVVTSSIPNEGKTTVSAALAKAMATNGKRTILIESDMRQRSMGNHLGIHGRAGIYAVLSGQVSLNSAIMPTRQQGLYFLDAEPRIPNPAGILSSKRFSQFVDTLEKEFDYVVFDTPPVGIFVDAAILSTLVDATAIVVRENYSKRNEVVNGFEQLKKAEANVIGVVLNGCEYDTSEYYYYAYYNADGKRVNKDRESSVSAGVKAVGSAAGSAAGRKEG